MTALKLYEGKDCTGELVTLQKDAPDLNEYHFLKKAQSMEVYGDPWIVFTETSYNGEFKCFKEGKYNSLAAFSISSARLVKGGLSDPKIRIYQNTYYCGKRDTLSKSVDSMKHQGMVSHEVISGAWILYSEDYYEGKKMVTVQGEALPFYPSFFGDQVRSLKPLED